MKKLDILDSNIDYQFTTFKIYIIGLIVLFLIFFLSWAPNAQVDLYVSSEPLIVNFEIKLNTNSTAVLLSLGTIPARIISFNQLSDIANNDEYRYIKDSSRVSDGEDEYLINETGEKIIIFRKQDLQEIVEYKIKILLDSSGENKQILEFHPEDWKIKVLNKDFSIGQTTIFLSLSEEVINEYDFEFLSHEIKFMNVVMAEDRLIKISTVKDVDIMIWPKFYKLMPLFNERINFHVYPIK